MTLGPEMHRVAIDTALFLHLLGLVHGPASTGTLRTKKLWEMLKDE